MVCGPKNADQREQKKFEGLYDHKLLFELEIIQYFKYNDCI